MQGENEVMMTDAAAPPAQPDSARTAIKVKQGDTNRCSGNSLGETVPATPPCADSTFGSTLTAAASIYPPKSRPRAATKSVYSAKYNHMAMSQQTPATLLGNQSEQIYLHIHETANKRISTLDYLRKAHEGRVYWFNTLLFDKSDLGRMPYFNNQKLSRRATNYLLLGMSLPPIIDYNSSTAYEFLRSLYILFGEFDAFQQIHTENGVSTSTLSRARLPQMFRRGTASGKVRRVSGAGDVGQAESTNGGMSGNSFQPAASVMTFGLGNDGNDLLPGEEYTHLLTPSLPFDPDFFETFSTLCEVLIDCYTRLANVITGPKECTQQVAELFAKTDAKVRKLIIQGVVKEFEDTSRNGLKQEIGMVSKVVLGSLS